MGTRDERRYRRTRRYVGTWKRLRNAIVPTPSSFLEQILNRPGNAAARQTLYPRQARSSEALLLIPQSYLVSQQSWNRPDVQKGPRTSRRRGRRQSLVGKTLSKRDN